MSVKGVSFYFIKMKSGYDRLFVAFSVAGRKKYRSFPYVDKTLWDNESSRFKEGWQMKGGDTDKLNEELDRIAADARGCRARYKLTKTISDEEMDSVLFGDSEKLELPQEFIAPRIDLGSDIQDFLSEKMVLHKWEPNTYKQVNASLRLLLEFQPDCTYSMFTQPFLQSFCVYMEETKGYAGATIQKRLSSVKYFLRWAETKGRTVDNEALSFQFRSFSDEKTIIFLSPEELASVYRTEIPMVGCSAVYYGPRGERKRFKVEYERTRNSLVLVKDLFLFCCFSGMRYSDMQNLKKKNIHRSLGMISYVSLKGKKKIDLETDVYMMEILDRHKSNPGIFALPRLSMQKFNAHIGDLMRICNISDPVFYVRYRAGKKEIGQAPKYEFVTSHTGRKTFVCTCIAANISLDIIVQWTGHAGPKEISPYLSVAESMKRRYMDKFWEGLKL